MTSVLEDVDVEWLRSMFSEEARCQLAEREIHHECSQKAMFSLRLRCGGLPQMLSCKRFHDFFQRSLALSPVWRCSYCDMPVRVCWEFISV